MDNLTIIIYIINKKLYTSWNVFLKKVLLIQVTAVSAGRSARRQIYRLPGGAERVVNTRCSTVVADVVSELCSLLGVESASEQSEFSLYCIVQGDAFTMPLAADEYILDVTTELLKSGQPFYLIFCR